MRRRPSHRWSRASGRLRSAGRKWRCPRSRARRALFALDQNTTLPIMASCVTSPLNGGKRWKSPRAAPRAAPNVGTSAKDRKGIFAPHLIIPAAYFARLSFGRAQSRQWFALDCVDVLHGFAGAFHQRPRGEAQGSKGFAIERAEERVVDRTDLGTDAVDLEPAGGRQREQHATAVVRTGPLEQQSEARHLAGL